MRKHRKKEVGKQVKSEKRPKGLLLRVIIAFVLVVIVVAVATFFSDPSFRGTPKVCFKEDVCVKLLDVLDTPEERHEGLLPYDHLNPMTGMFFVFPEEQTTGFWMRGMKFSIDLVRINKAGRVVQVDENMPPCPEEPCEIFNSFYLSKYAVELPAGFVKEHGIGPGDKVRFEHIKYD